MFRSCSPPNSDHKKTAASNYQSGGSAVTHKPGSVYVVQSLARHLAIIPLESTLPKISSSLPRDTDGPSLSVPIRGLAPDGVCLAALVTEGAVGSYPTVSPFPFQFSLVRWSILCGTVLEVASTGCYPASCPMEPGLSSKSKIRRPPVSPLTKSL